MSHNNNNRKRSRWGDRQPDNAQQRSLPDVSDQEALNALLSSAKSTDEKYKARPQQQQNNNDNRPNSDNPKRHRKDDDSNGFDRQHRGSQQHRRRDNDTSSNQNKKVNGPDYSYYGQKETKSDSNNKEGESNNPDDEPAEKEKPDFGLSGALAQEQVGDFKFREPPEARAPNTRWRFYVFKGDEALETLHISRQSAYLIGRNKELCDILLLHPSLSGQHAVLQYRALPRKEDGQIHVKPYLMDLESTNGTFINGNKLEHARYYELKKGDVLTFGASTREYVLLTENTTSIK
ncbi:Smad nuclear interacting protein 1 [Seminavis robusta]|uniref:Smad nuclear interacting protein 1 n=1 Tax=Seminavis robusta TaxID=568900 RepID=A0A9N8EB49_9STRA|nr:Smad nuclear interacting protein 1 [Seminavis robusta]|eukprot:Sro827_g207910.1 Smad nuclear interacting protein 1 (291) ;mRNA; r:38966-39838